MGALASRKQAVVLVSILALEHPYQGITRVNAEAFHQAQRIMSLPLPWREDASR